MSMSEIQQRPQPPTTTTTTTGGVTNVSSTSSTRSPSPPINSIVKHELVEHKAKPIQVSPIVPQQQQLPTPPVKTAASAAASSVKSTPAKVNMSGPICGNCQTQTTPLWRRDESGQVLCNACGLFLKLHGRPRPISLKTDTIKSRNRVKQSGTSSGKSTGPNTPELKSKEGKNGKKSPKPKKKSNNTGANSNENNTLTPLLPATANNTPSSFKSSNSSQTSLHNHHHLPNHVLQTHQVPLHYPSSTPTQFAPGLQRITSPLMLSTSSAVRNEPSDRKLTPIQAAAGALENMSNELGPSATFKKGTSNINGISLMNNRKNDSTSSSGSSSIFSSVAPSAPKLPALGSKIPSPVASRPYSRSSTPLQTLPPLHKMASSDSSLPSIHNISSFSHGTNNDNQKPFNQQQQNNSHSPNNNNNNNQDGSNNNNNENNNNNGGNSFTGNAHEVTLLKTRISELELVNDLYRTRIMELEAMEQAARLRENSMKKRLEEVMNLQASYQQLSGVNPMQPPMPPSMPGPPPPVQQYHTEPSQQQQQQQQPPQQPPQPQQSVSTTTTSQPQQSMPTSTLDTRPMDNVKYTNESNVSTSSIQQNEQIVLPPIKRDRDDDSDESNKKPKLS